jgi:hypothetical protein
MSGKTFASVVIFALAVAEPAMAADMLLAHPAWAAAPSQTDVAAAVPKTAIGHRSHNALLRCQLGPDGSVGKCVVQLSEGAEFDRAALSLSHEFQAILPPSLVSDKDRLFVDIGFTFRDPGQPAQPIRLTQIEALGQPPLPPGDTGFPAAADKAGIKRGVGVLDCDGGKDGGLSNCVVAEDTPPGLGFGDEALVIARSLKLNKWQDGVAVNGSRLRLPIFMAAPGYADDPTATRQAIFHVPSGWPGTAGPYYPERAYRMRINGTATLQCGLSATGALSNCVGVSEKPAGEDFMLAALKMASRGAISALPTVVGNDPVASDAVRVVVPFTLPR